jgi:hypothetical protein
MSSKMKKSIPMGPFQRQLAYAMNGAHPKLSYANGEKDEILSPKHAPGAGWLPTSDGTGGWMRPSSRGIGYIDVWYPEHDQIIDIGNAASLPSQPEYQVPDLCGTVQIEMIEERKHSSYAKENENSAANERWTVAQTQAILAIARLQLVLSSNHKDNFDRMVAEKQANSLLTARY